MRFQRNISFSTRMHRQSREKVSRIRFLEKRSCATALNLHDRSSSKGCVRTSSPLPTTSSDLHGNVPSLLVPPATASPFQTKDTLVVIGSIISVISPLVQSCYCSCCILGLYMLVRVMVMIYIMNLIMKLPTFLTVLAYVLSF
jgi:hypothetical protein